jgi:hypothetical protein
MIDPRTGTYAFWGINMDLGKDGTRVLPLVGTKIPAIVRSNEDLPDPLAPEMSKFVPGERVSDKLVTNGSCSRF